MMRPRKKRKFVYGLIVTILILIVTIFVILFSATDMFKSNHVLFEKYALQLLNNIDSIFNEQHMIEIEEILENNKLTSDITATVNYSENGQTKNPINNIQMNIQGQEDRKNGYEYKDIRLMQNEESLIGFSYIKEENISGIRLNGIRQYVSTDSNDQEDNIIKKIFSLINTDLETLIGLDFEDLKALKEKYLGIIGEQIQTARFSKKTGIILEINGVQYDTNVYTLTLTKEQFNNIYIMILEELVRDEIILSKIENIDNKLNEYHELVQDGKNSNYRQAFIDELNCTIQEIQNTNIGNNERTISVYETNGIAISLSIDTEDNFIGMDWVNDGKNSFLNFLGNEKIEAAEKENSFNLKIQKKALVNEEEINISYCTVEEGEKVTNECSVQRKMEDISVNSNINFSRNVQQNTLEIGIEKVTNIINTFEEKEQLMENENNIMLESLTEEQTETVRNNLENELLNQINQFTQIVSLNDLNQICINMKFMEEQLEEIANNDEVTEIERNRFNANFELYEGEYISKDRVKELIDSTKENLKDVRVTNFTGDGEEQIPLEYRLVIERKNENVELAQSVITYIEENYKEEFSVRLEYDESTGLVSDIYITVMEE